MLDILIKNGWIADGTGNPLIPADVAIEGDRIVHVGSLPGATATRVIEAAGKIVCPGFVDIHSHSDATIMLNPTAQSTIRQGITTEVVGNCGESPAPLPGPDSGFTPVPDPLGMGTPETTRWNTFAQFLDVIDMTGITPNMAWLVGHNTLRRAAGVVGSHVTAAQAATMQALLREGLDAGAVGLSTGLEFDPGRRATPDEIVALAQVVGERVPAGGGYYASHIRNRAKTLQPAIEEFVETVRRTGCRGQVSHLNVRANTGAAEDAWARAVATVEQARAEGLDIQADCTPYVDGGGSPAAILPMWVTEEGPRRAAELLRDPAVREQVKTDCDRYWAFIVRGDWHRVRISGSSEHPEIMGRNFLEIADLWHKDPWDCLFDLFVESMSGAGRVSYIGQLFTEAHVASNIRHPLFSLGVDAATGAAEGPLKDRYFHPLPFAGMVHYLTYWVREKQVLRLEEAIRKMTSMPAARFGLRGRGLLRSGAYADVVVFDYDALDDVATPENPVAYCKGIEQVLVNGVPVIANGEHTSAVPGRTLGSAS
jgi:N-acyl-D-amino-acid deacylase